MNTRHTDQVADHLTNDEFHAMLDRASANAQTATEKLFVVSLASRWASQGCRMHLSLMSIKTLDRLCAA